MNVERQIPSNAYLPAELISTPAAIPIGHCAGNSLLKIPSHAHKPVPVRQNAAALLFDLGNCRYSC